jgi:uncharacterized protein involved in exopolysaccharide biosynthesis
MEQDPLGHPYGDFESDGAGVSPHLADYWQIISRRLWLVLVIFAVTTASAIWAVSRQKTQFRADLSLQVNDPLARTRAINPTARISGMDIYVDPIESEIQVLTSGTVALAVVDSLGLRLAPTSPDLVRSELFLNAKVAQDAPEGNFELAYDDAGERVLFREPAGIQIATGVVGQPLDVGFASFVPQPPPREDRIYGAQVIPMGSAVSLVRGGIAAVPRELTNLIDVSYITDDRQLAPQILIQAAEALRAYGERKISTAARKEADFIEGELASARSELEQSLTAIQEFKESQAFTNLSVQEQRLVDETQGLTEQIQDLEEQRGRTGFI